MSIKHLLHDKYGTDSLCHSLDAYDGEDAGIYEKIVGEFKTILDVRLSSCVPNWIYYIFFMCFHGQSGDPHSLWPSALPYQPTDLTGLHKKA